MKNQAVLLIFAALFSASIAAPVPWGLNCTAVVSNDNWQCGSDFSLPELASPLMLILPNNTEVFEYGLQICLQNKLGLAHPSHWNADSCTYYQSIGPVETAPVSTPVEAPKAEEPVAAPVEAPTAQPVAAPVEAPKAEEPVAAPKAAFMFSAVNAHGFLPSGRYVVGVAFVKPPTGNFSRSLQVGLTANICDGGPFGDWDCSLTPVKAPFPSKNVSFNLVPGMQDTFSAPINTVLYGSVTVKTNSLVGLHLRRNGYPFVNPAEFAWNDANSNNGELTLNNPVPGDYLIAALLSGNVNETDFVLDSDVKVCNASANVAGPDCTTSVVELGEATGQLYSGTAGSSMVYYKLNVDLFNKSRLSFSVASMKASDPTPRVYVRWGNLPDENNYDFVGCSTQYCAVNQVDLEVLSGSAGDWYIGVVAGNATESYAFGIWHGSVCANNCGGDHGTCNTEGEKMGTCTCNAGFDLIDCSQVASDGLSPEMIVLIVMGALVVLSAVIGFIAWAYMRRKRGYDEIQ